MERPFVLFDFDGVIADSFDPAYEVRKMICPALTEEHYRKLFEGNINDALDDENTHTDRCRHDINFFAEYIPRMESRVPVMPGMEDVLRELSGSYTLIVVSSTVTSPIQDFLEKNGLAEYFTEVMGNDVHKSKVEKIKMIFAKYSAEPGKCVFVTDTLGDMREASKTEVGSIGVSWGFHTHETLALGHPFRVVDAPGKLPETISEYFKRSG